MGLYDSFEEDISSPSNSLTRVNVEELFDDPKLYIQYGNTGMYVPSQLAILFGHTVFIQSCI